MTITNILIKDGKQIDKDEHFCSIAQTEKLFEVVQDFIKGTVIWNAGRKNFNFEGYIPLVNMDDRYTVFWSKICFKS